MNHLEQLKKVPAEGWQELFAFIPPMEEMVKASFSKFPTEAEALALAHPLVATLRKWDMVLHFPWERWEIGKRLMLSDEADYSTLNAVDLCKMLATIIKSNQVAKGVLSESVANGSMLAILQALQGKMQELQ